MNEHRTVTNIAVCKNNIMVLVSRLVGWLDSGAPTPIIQHHSLILPLSGPELNQGEHDGGLCSLQLCIMSYRHSSLVVALNKRLCLIH